jgi:hypothetical protein
MIVIFYALALACVLCIGWAALCALVEFVTSCAKSFRNWMEDRKNDDLL